LSHGYGQVSAQQILLIHWHLEKVPGSGGVAEQAEVTIHYLRRVYRPAFRQVQGCGRNYLG
jgi:hypothetical protein